jgi:ABC-type Na+ efflux pump permease subunit
MMRAWQVVFRKELTEVFREARTRFAVIVSPLLITPLLLAVVGTMAKQQATDAQKETVPVAFVGLDRAPAMRNLLREPPNFKIVEQTRAQAEAAIRARSIQAAIILP